MRASLRRGLNGIRPAPQRSAPACVGDPRRFLQPTAIHTSTFRRRDQAIRHGITSRGPGSELQEHHVGLRRNYLPPLKADERSGVLLNQLAERQVSDGRPLRFKCSNYAGSAEKTAL